MSGIRRGKYFLVTGPHCQTCDFRAICHRTQSLSHWRAEADRAQTKEHRDVRFAKLSISVESDKETKKE